MVQVRHIRRFHQLPLYQQSLQILLTLFEPGDFLVHVLSPLHRFTRVLQAILSAMFSANLFLAAVWLLENKLIAFLISCLLAVSFLAIGQWFSTEGDFAFQGTFGNVWR